MSAYTWTPVVVAGILLVIIGAVVAMLLRWRKIAHIPWQEIPGYPTSARYFVEGELSPTFLVDALREAERLLAVHTKWGSNVVKVFDDVHVYVRDSESWKDLWGRTVAGLDPTGHVIVVGASLAALCHEMAHQAEEKLDRVVDSEHAGWGPKGITTAIDAFDAWMMHRRAAERLATGIVAVIPSKVLRKLEACRYAGGAE